jgi:hypothetical protein
MAPSNTQSALISLQRRPATNGLPVAPGGLTDQPPALATAAPCPNHFGVGSGFIDEDELSCVSQFDCGNAWPTRVIGSEDEGWRSVEGTPLT